MFCKFCGAEIDDESAFCNKCGKVLCDKVKDSGNQEEEKKEKKSFKKFTMIAIAFAAVAITLFMSYTSLTGIKVVKKDVEAGSVVTAKDIIKVKSSNATITLDGEVDTSTLGENVIKCHVSNGIFKANKTIKINVVDTTAPVIEGEDSITIISGREFLVGDYYSVSDFERIASNSIELSPTIDTDLEGTQKVFLKVKDSSGNEGTKEVEVNVLKLSKNEENVLDVINKYISDGNKKESVLSSAWIMYASGGSNGVDYYVEVASNVLYAVYDSGRIAEFTVSDCGGSTMHELMVYAVHYDGVLVNTAKLVN
ncbi:MAG: zinc-ribbon domain-containing protein [Clostridium sp.]|nr:zinc-ribbon domain-containing protein [Clostridium sp.]